MGKPLDDIGFYTLTDERARQASSDSPMWRCELILTDACNFKCPYCRGLQKSLQGRLSFGAARRMVDVWVDDGLRNIRFSGGEPLVWPHLPELVGHAARRGIERIAISTNGSFPLEDYKRLVDAGVNDFSISLDACCSQTAERMSGGRNYFSTIINNIGVLSRLTYVTVGVVLTDDNMRELQNIVWLAHNLGVADIRIISAAQWNRLLGGALGIGDDLLRTHPILRYRVNNIKRLRNVRGLQEGDSRRCRLVLDDSTIARDWHFPCVIYMREGGRPIGRVSSEGMREEREQWSLLHDTHQDPICRAQCLDVCIDYNNRWEELHNGMVA